MKVSQPVLPVIAAALLSACATPTEPIGPKTAHTLHAVTADMRLVSFNGGQPQTLLANKPLAGLQPGERVLGVDYRVAKGQLYALGSSGRLYRVDVPSATVTQVGPVLPVPLRGTQFGFDFNPTVDRIRVVSDAGVNMRLHPDTGAVVDTAPAVDGVQLDGGLAYAAGDPHAGQAPDVVAAAYTYNPVDDKITTNFAIDARRGLLVTQGTREGTKPGVSPNTGVLYTVGPLQAGPFADASFDIGDVKNPAYAALTQGQRSRLVSIDLATGKATRIGTIAGGQPVVGLAIEP